MPPEVFETSPASRRRSLVDRETNQGAAIVGEPVGPRTGPTPVGLTLDVSSVWSARRAATPSSAPTTLGAMLFLAGAAVAVAAAGFLGIALWGPEHPTPRTSMAAMGAEPASSFELPSSSLALAVPPAVEAAPVEAAPVPPADVAPPAPAAEAPVEAPAKPAAAKNAKFGKKPSGPQRKGPVPIGGRSPRAASRPAR